LGNDVKEIFNRVYEFHGHVCLMSTAGVRIALCAMDAIGLNKSDEYLFSIYHARTCAVDPIQFITGCTLGNSNVIIKDNEKSHTLKLVRQSDGTGVKVTLKEDVLKRMKDCMVRKKSGANVEDEDERKLLKDESDKEFNDLLDFLRNEDESVIVSVEPFSMDIKPYLRF
jgi:formylmethanofuran dehydrogenase subunit E